MGGPSWRATTEDSNSSVESIRMETYKKEKEKEKKEKWEH